MWAWFDRLVTSITWVDVTFTWDLIFIMFYCLYDIFKTCLKLHTRLLGKKT